MRPSGRGPQRSGLWTGSYPKTAGVTSSPPLLSHPHAGTPARPHARTNGDYAAAATPPAATRTVAIFTLARPSPGCDGLWEAQREALGAFIREQRKSANLSLRQLAELTSLSNPYLSQVERGLHQPSVRVLKAISDALNLSAESLMAQAGLIDAIASTSTAEDGADPKTAVATEDAIRADRRLSEDQKAALIAVYRSMLG